MNGISGLYMVCSSVVPSGTELDLLLFLSSE